MRRALSSAGRQLSRSHAHGAGGGGVLLAARRGISLSAQEAAALPLPPSLSTLVGGRWLRAIASPPATATTGWHGGPSAAGGFNLSGGGGLSTCAHDRHARPEGHEGIAGTSSSSLQSPRCPSKKTETTTKLPAHRLQQHRGYASASRSLRKDSTDAKIYYETIGGNRYDRKVLDACRAARRVIDLRETVAIMRGALDGPSKAQGRGVVSAAGAYHLLTIVHVFKPHLSCLMYLLSLKRPRYYRM
jgi:hypothetical protein